MAPQQWGCNRDIDRHVAGQNPFAVICLESFLCFDGHLKEYFSLFHTLTQIVREKLLRFIWMLTIFQIDARLCLRIDYTLRICKRSVAALACTNGDDEKVNRGWDLPIINTITSQLSTQAAHGQ